MRQGGPGRITRLAIFGEDFWVNHLASGLTERYGEKLVVEAFPSVTHSAGSIRVVCALLRSDVTLSVGLLEQVIQPYAPVTGPQESRTCVHFSETHSLLTHRSVSQCALSLSAHGFWFCREQRIQICMAYRDDQAHATENGSDFMYWIGSDVTLALQRHEETPRLTRRWTCSNAPHSLTVAQHLTDELLTIGVHSVVRPFPKPLPGGPIPSLPPRLTVLAYLPSSRFAFYGGTTVLEAARRLQDVEFLIIGGAMPAGEQAYDNVTVLGMQSDMYAVYERATVLGSPDGARRLSVNRGRSTEPRAICHTLVRTTVLHTCCSWRHRVTSSCTSPTTGAPRRREPDPSGGSGRVGEARVRSRYQIQRAASDPSWGLPGVTIRALTTPFSRGYALWIQQSRCVPTTMR